MRFVALLSLIFAACTAPVRQISIDPSEVHLASAKATASLHATAKDDKGSAVADVKIAWSSSNPTVATVDDVGKVTAIKSGSTDIAATAGNIKGTAHVEVAILHGLDISPAKLSLAGPQQAAQLHLVAKDDAGHEMAAASPIWLSSNAGIASVDNAGNVHAVEPGTATITARVGELTATTTVTVARPTAQKPQAATKKRHG